MGLSRLLLYQVMIFTLSSLISLHGIFAGDPRLAIVLFLEMQKLIHAKVKIVNDLIPVSLIVPGEVQC